MPTDDDQMSGLARLQAMIAGRERSPIADALLFDLVEAQPGRAVFRATPGRHAYNPIGCVHGGYAATLLDSACGCAVLSMLPAARAYTTLEIKVAYHRALTDETGEVTVEGRVSSIGSRVAFSEAKLVDREGRLCASATSTLLLFDRRA